MPPSPPDPSSPVPEPQRLLLSVLASLPDTAVVVVDEQLVLRFVCGPAFERYGWTHDEVVGRSLADVMGPRAAVYEPHYRIALDGGTSTLEAPDEHGKLVYRTEFLPLRLGGEGIAGAIAVVRDITEHVEHRAAIERSEREFRLLAENATDVISRYAMDSTWLYASPAVTPMLGWRPEELVGRSSLAMVHPDDYERCAAALADLNANTASLTVRYRIADSAGRWVWVETVARKVTDADGAPEINGAMRDITLQVAAESAEREAQERFRLAFDDAPIGMALVDLDGRFTRVNAVLCDLLERSADELLSLTFQEITDPEDLDTDLDQLQRLISGEIPRYQMEKRYLGPDGSPIWTQLSVSLLRDVDGNPAGSIAQIQDIGERKRMQDALQHLADHDMLTGLWNRRRFEEELQRELVRARRQGTPTALLLLDLDALKEVNDTYGHACGDELIRAVAHAVRGRLRESDAVARIGGDEFAILLPSVDAAAAVSVAEKVCATVRDLAVELGELTLRTTASVGVAPADPGGADLRALTAAADRAMYAAKAAGGDSVATATP